MARDWIYKKPKPVSASVCVIEFVKAPPLQGRVYKSADEPNLTALTYLSFIYVCVEDERELLTKKPNFSIYLTSLAWDAPLYS